MLQLKHCLKHCEHVFRYVWHKNCIHYTNEQPRSENKSLGGELKWIYSHI